MKKEIIHYTRTGYNGDMTYDALCGKKVKGVNVTTAPEKADCTKCLAHAKYKDDLGHSTGKTKTNIKRRIFIESDILQANELRRAQREAFDLAKERGLKCTDKVFSQVLDYAWHDLENTWTAVKAADEVYAVSSLIPLSGGSYIGAPVIFNGCCERAVKEGVKGKDVYILNRLENIDWSMIDIKIMKQAFKNNNLYMYDDELNLVKVNVSKIKK